MSRKLRAKSWAAYGISPWRKREIMSWCRQYPDWKKELQYGLRSISSNGGSHSSNIGRPTEQQAIRNAELQEKILLVEHAIQEVCPQIETEMLDNIGYGVPYVYLQVPYSDRDFYSFRIAVYALISERRKI